MQNNHSSKLKIFNWVSLLLLFFFTNSYSQSSFLSKSENENYKAHKYDMGKMWTFENPPLDYFKSEYNFSPAVEWLDNVRKSALKFGNGCSASFVSADGLIMTNHHCVRAILPSLNKGDMDLLRDGFFAKNLEMEIKVPRLFVNELMTIKDITNEIQSAMAEGNTESEKIELRDKKIEEIKNQAHSEDSDLDFKIIALYNGGKYSLYGYKKFDDIRLVFVPDLRTAKLGGDYDNFTYPRHGLDCAFLRAYENDKPVKTKYFFKWSKNGAEEGEPIFVVGNPGSSNRISTIAQIEYARNFVYPQRVKYFTDIYDLYLEKVKASNAEDYSLIARLYGLGNALKVYNGTLEGLNNPMIIARKKDFERKFKEAVNANPELKNKYGHLWDDIASIKKQSAEYSIQLSTFGLFRYLTSEYISIAQKIVQAAKKLKGTDENARLNDEVLKDIFPEDFDKEFNDKFLKAQIDYLYFSLGDSNPIVNEFLGGRKGNEAVSYLLSNSNVTSREGVHEFKGKTATEILNSKDPFIKFVIDAEKTLNELEKNYKELNAKEAIDNQLLGEALFAVYGDSIPPDATGTLRISDGVIKSYSYNGTVAPTHTTFYGVLDKYYSFNKKFPFNLPAIWNNLPEDFDLSTPLDFISTNDIIGGNSGSPVINKNAEIVGLAFDGNYESLPANYIYTTEANRTVSVHSEGIVEGIRDLYKATRLSDEILNGGINK